MNPKNIIYILRIENFRESDRKKILEKKADIFIISENEDEVKVIMTSLMAYLFSDAVIHKFGAEKGDKYFTLRLDKAEFYKKLDEKQEEGAEVEISQLF